MRASDLVCAPVSQRFEQRVNEKETNGVMNVSPNASVSIVSL